MKLADNISFVVLMMLPIVLNAESLSLVSKPECIIRQETRTAVATIKQVSESSQSALEKYIADACATNGSIVMLAEREIQQRINDLQRKSDERYDTAMNLLSWSSWIIGIISFLIAVVGLGVPAFNWFVSRSLNKQTEQRLETFTKQFTSEMSKLTSLKGKFEILEKKAAANDWFSNASVSLAMLNATSNATLFRQGVGAASHAIVEYQKCNDLVKMSSALNLLVRYYCKYQSLNDTDKSSYTEAMHTFQWMFSPKQLCKWFGVDNGDNSHSQHEFDCAYGSFEKMYECLGVKVEEQIGTV